MTHLGHTAAQVLTSANYGGAVANFLTGGLSLQVEHHLFPAISFLHYPAISRIVASECAARGIPYSRYAGLPEAIAAFCRCAHRVLCVQVRGTRHPLLALRQPAQVAAPRWCRPCTVLRREAASRYCVEGYTHVL